MKLVVKILLGVAPLIAVQFGASGCVADGYVSGRENVYYGSDPWIHDGPWLDGRHGYHNAPDAYIHPPPFHGRAPTVGHPQPPSHGPDHASDHHPEPTHQEPNHHEDHHPDQDHH